MKQILFACLISAGLPCFADPLPLQEAPAEFARQAANCKAGDTVTLAVALEESSLDTEYAAGRLRIRYSMIFKHVTEGWNWHPEAVPQGGDYYRFKYLPLGSQVEEKSRTTRQDADGVHREYVNRWQYDYFFTFDNPDDFYGRDDEENTGFVAEIELPPAEAQRLTAGDLRMAMRGQLATGCITESTTYWSGLPAKPVDFTLKKRYLIGKLSEVIFHDARNGNVLARLVARQSAP
ncbi:hypothetical protein MASR1M60_20930 [Rhodocyclaceae bacterium]